MAKKQLDNLVTAGALKTEDPSATEIDSLIRSGEARLTDAANESLSIESRFDLAYNAAHALSLAALRWHGYRPDKRYIVFQALAHTLDIRDFSHGRRLVDAGYAAMRALAPARAA